jgi:hypothetical protein
MKLTENDIRVLTAIARYHVLSASMIHRMVFPDRADRRHTRRRLQQLLHENYLRRSSVSIAFSSGNFGPVYSVTDRACDVLAVYHNDDAWLAVNTKPPRNDRLHHWLDIAWAHWIVTQATESCDAVKLDIWINEWQSTGDVDGNPTGFVLHSQFREQPPLSCSPDAAFLLEIGGHRRVLYVEIDRGTTGVRRVAASKSPGYAELAARKTHRRHFPTTTFDDFSVLLITVSGNHRDRLRCEVAKKTEHRPDLWLFASRDEFTPEAALFGDIFHDHTGAVGPLLSRSLIRDPEDGVKIATGKTTEDSHDAA